MLVNGSNAQIYNPIIAMLYRKLGTHLNILGSLCFKLSSVKYGPNCHYTGKRGEATNDMNNLQHMPLKVI